MYSKAIRTFVVGAAVAARCVFAATELNVLTPVLTQCQNATVQFTGGQPNYLVSVVPSADPCSDSLIDIAQTSETSVNFLVKIPAGTSVEIVVDDAEGGEGWSATTVVQPSGDSSCLPKAANVSSSAPAVNSSAAVSSSSVASASGTPGPSGSTSASSSDSSDPWAVPPAAVQSGTIGSTTNSSDGSVNVGSDPNTSDAASGVALSVGSVLASALFMFAVSQL